MRPAGDAPRQDTGQEPEARAWIVLDSQQEIEAWIERLNRELQQIAYARQATPAPDRRQSHGVCLALTHGGEIILQTNPDGDILLDVGNEADWVAPLIVAATGVQMPRGTLWVIPGDRLIELIIGLNSLIESERLVLRHHFRSRY